LGTGAVALLGLGLLQYKLESKFGLGEFSMDKKIYETHKAGLGHLLALMKF
jgi:hypothetical protein